MTAHLFPRTFPDCVECLGPKRTQAKQEEDRMNPLYCSIRGMFAVLVVFVAVLTASPFAFSQTAAAAEDSPVFKAFSQLKGQTSYRMTSTLSPRIRAWLRWRPWVWA